MLCQMMSSPMDEEAGAGLVHEQPGRPQRNEEMED